MKKNDIPMGPWRWLTGIDINFRIGPTSTVELSGPVKIATLEDTCGNLIQLVEKPR